MREENIKTVEAYLNALKQKDLSLAPLADDVAFEDPLAGKTRARKIYGLFCPVFCPR